MIRRLRWGLLVLAIGGCAEPAPEVQPVYADTLYVDTLGEWSTWYERDTTRHLPDLSGGWAWSNDKWIWAGDSAGYVLEQVADSMAVTIYQGEKTTTCRFTMREPLIYACTSAEAVRVLRAPEEGSDG